MVNPVALGYWKGGKKQKTKKRKWIDHNGSDQLDLAVES